MVIDEEPFEPLDIGQIAMENDYTTFGKMATNPTNKGESTTSEDKVEKKSGEHNLYENQGWP